MRGQCTNTRREGDIRDEVRSTKNASGMGDHQKSRTGWSSSGTDAIRCAALQSPASLFAFSAALALAFSCLISYGLGRVSPVFTRYRTLFPSSLILRTGPQREVGRETKARCQYVQPSFLYRTRAYERAIRCGAGSPERRPPRATG